MAWLFRDKCIHILVYTLHTHSHTSTNTHSLIHSHTDHIHKQACSRYPTKLGARRFLIIAYTKPAPGKPHLLARLFTAPLQPGSSPLHVPPEQQPHTCSAHIPDVFTNNNGTPNCLSKLFNS